LPFVVYQKEGKVGQTSFSTKVLLKIYPQNLVKVEFSTRIKIQTKENKVSSFKKG
jgi:hypothetical protein